MRFLLFFLLFGALISANALLDYDRALGIAMEGYPYPYEVSYLDISAEGQDLRMAFMDIPPMQGDNGETVVLMHGKNFYAAYWDRQIYALINDGFRVIALDQIGFGKSSKPEIYYSFHRLAYFSKMVLDARGVEKAHVMAHSFGGMLATRFALLYPNVTSTLILANPIGLEDYREKVPWVPIEVIYQGELDKTEEGIRQFHMNYYVNWQPEYEEFVQVNFRWTLSAEYPRWAMSSALTYRTLYEQPVVWEFKNLKMPTLLALGQHDRTCPRGNTITDPNIVCGDIPTIGREVAAEIPDSTLVEFYNSGHLPFLEETVLFNQMLLKWLAEHPMKN